MAPSKKKKKASSNPARGFATVSQPSKKETSYVPSEVENPITPGSYDLQATSKNAESNNDCALEEAPSSDLQSLSPEQLELHLEDAELQNIIDFHSSRCKQDAARQVARLENERRQMRSQAHKLSATSWLPDEIVDEILDKKADRWPVNSRSISENHADDTALLLKVWTLEEVLSACNFPQADCAIENIIELALENKVAGSVDYIWGLPDTLEFFAAISPQVSLPDYEQKASDSLSSTVDASTTPAPGHVESASQTDIVRTLVSPLHSISSDEGNDSENQHDLPILSSSDSDDDDNPAHLLQKYLKWQTLLFHTEHRIGQAKKKSPALDQRKSRLQRRIDRLRQDILFDSEAADTVWNQQLKDLRVQISRSSRAQKAGTETPQIAKELDGISGEEEETDMLGDIFGTADNGVNEIGDKPGDQETVRIVDFGKPSGTQPRILLEESCYSSVESCAIKFSTLLATSYSVRQKVELKWSANYHLDEQSLLSVPDEVTCVATAHKLTVEMISIATSTTVQAESYLSTIIIFLIVHSGLVDRKHSNRLSTVWRDLYHDLCERRQRVVNTRDKQKLKALTSKIHAIKERLDRDQKVQATTTKSEFATSDLARRHVQTHARFSNDEAKSQWLQRSSSLAYKNMLKLREQLPVHRCKETILQAIDKNRVTIICADTGAGKSTQVPSFILEHELSRGHDSRVLVTQPRRISAISLARRVSQELGEPHDDLGTSRSLIGFAIRLESKTSKSTRITFATTGVLLRMIEASPQLEELDYLILDEVHERTMDIDLLFISLKKLQTIRTDLKIVLMSATVDAQKFSNYFEGAPILNVPGRTFPVEVRYLEDAIEDSLDINVNGHSGDYYDDEMDDSENSEHEDEKLVHTGSYSSRTRAKLARMNEHQIDYELVANVAETIATKDNYVRYSSAILIFMPGIGEIRRLHNVLLSRNVFASNWIIHLLHSSFSTDDLERAFSIPQLGYRKIVIATNIAETGITIPDVTAVIDTCKEKVMRFNERRQLSKLSEGFISRSSARQRRGRAARVQEGLCFHLVTRHRMENLMLEQHVPEMLRLSLQDPILRIKVWNLGSIEESLAAAIDPPIPRNVRRAVEKLKDAGALSHSEELTHLGKIIARLPLEVVLSKLAIFGIVFKCLDAALTIASALSSKSPFLVDKSGTHADPRLAFARGDSDLISIYNAHQAWRRAKAAGQAHQFCKKNRLNDQNFSAIEDQKTQLLVYLVDAGLLQFNPEERLALAQSRTSKNRHATFQAPERYNVHEHDPVINCVIAQAFYPKILLREGKGWRNVYSNQRMSLTSNSIIRTLDKPPKWLCFYEAMQTRSGSLNVNETSKVLENMIVMLLGSAVEYKFFSGVIGLDHGKMRFSTRQWRQLAAIKSLRESVATVLDRCWQTPGLWVRPSDQAWLDLLTSIFIGKNNDIR